MRLSEGEDDDEKDEIDEMGRENREEKRNGEDETIKRARALHALNLGAEPKEESRPKNEHNKRGSGAGEVEERGREDGDDRGEKGDV